MATCRLSGPPSGCPFLGVVRAGIGGKRRAVKHPRGRGRGRGRVQAGCRSGGARGDRLRDAAGTVWKSGRLDREEPALAACGLRLAIGAIVKNEGPYLLEWIAYHRVLGVDRFFIADNGSDRRQRRRSSRPSTAAGIVRHLPFPDRPGERPQLPAYGEILRRHGAEADWIAFIDADEFLLPARGRAERCAAAPRRASAPIRASARWRSTGRSTAPRADSRPGRGLVDRALRRAAPSGRSLPNRHFKSILRTAAGAGGRPRPARLPPAPALPHGARRRPRPSRRMPSASTA